MIKTGEKMNKKMYHRFDISEKIWANANLHLMKQHKQHIGIAKDNRKFYINTKSKIIVDKFVTWLWKVGDSVSKIY